MIRQWLDNFNTQENLAIWLVGIFLFTLFVSFRALRLIIFVAIKKHLFDEPDERSTHDFKVPTLGGIGFFICLMLVIGVSGAFQDSKTLIILSGGLTLLFFIGLKDDIFLLAPFKKFLGQLIASTLLVTLTDLRIIGFSNLLSVETLPYWVSIAFTVFVFILIINAFNLIDGINGLAGSIGLMATLVFATIFYLTDSWIPATLAVALAGSLIPFLRLNMVKPKIFMGDTGSMILGFMLAFFTISFINQSQINPEAMFNNSVPIMVEAILFFPLLDTLRIFIIRIFVHKTSPFKADRNHIHHHLLDLGLTHMRSTTSIVLMNLGIIILALGVSNLEIHVQLLIVSGVGSFLFLLPFLKKIRNSKQVNGTLGTASDK